MRRSFVRAALVIGIFALFLGASPCWAQTGAEIYYPDYGPPEYGAIYNPAPVDYVYSPPERTYYPSEYYAPPVRYNAYGYGNYVYGRSAYNRIDSGYNGPGYGLPPVAYGIASPASAT